ncbi:3775_t:CDS:1, partial [Dentiscutata heterogama]
IFSTQTNTQNTQDSENLQIDQQSLSTLPTPSAKKNKNCTSPHNTCHNPYNHTKSGQNTILLFANHQQSHDSSPEHSTNS